jgi:hypothetical protein
VNVAPTLSVLLGVGVPAEDEGRPLFGALALDAAARAEWGVGALIARRNRALAYADALGVAPPPPDIGLSARNALAGRQFAQATSDADDGLDQLDAWAEGAREERLTSDRLWRIPAGLFGLAVPIAAAFLLRQRRETLLALPFGAVYAAAYWVIFVWRGYGISLSALDQAGTIDRFALDGSLSAAVVAAALGVIVGLAYHSKGTIASLRLVARYLFWAVALLVWQVAVYVVLYGATYRLYLPDSTLALVYFVDLLQLVGIGIVCLPLAGLAVAHATSARPGSAPRGR